MNTNLSERRGRDHDQAQLADRFLFWVLVLCSVGGLIVAAIAVLSGNSLAIVTGTTAAVIGGVAARVQALVIRLQREFDVLQNLIEDEENPA